MSDTAVLDQTITTLRVLRTRMRRAVTAPAQLPEAAVVHDWTHTIDAAIAELAELERRARYAEILDVAIALADVAGEGPGRDHDPSFGQLALDLAPAATCLR